MAKITPFCALRPKADLAAQIAALPYDVYTREEAHREVQRHPLSFLKIDRAETQMAPGVDLYAEEVYQKAAGTLREMIDEGSFEKEEKPCLYVYELTRNGHTQTGLVACVSVREYEEGKIKKHENTRAQKEEDRVRHIDACQAQTGPIFLAYRQREEIRILLQEVKKEKPLYDFLSEDDILHRVWSISNTEKISQFVKAFSFVDSLYIADGHHRAASAVRVANMRRKKEGRAYDTLSSPEYERFLAVLFPDQELTILDYNRWVQDLNGNTTEEFLQKVEERFTLQHLPAGKHPEKKGTFTMYLQGNWYLLQKKEPQTETDLIAQLDVSLLQNELLAPVLGIKDPKTDPRISFVGGVRGLEELVRLSDENGGVSFALFPTSMDELLAVADAGKLMPPKSTWFEPKLRSGLFLHQI